MSKNLDVLVPVHKLKKLSSEYGKPLPEVVSLFRKIPNMKLVSIFLEENNQRHTPYERLHYLLIFCYNSKELECSIEDEDFVEVFIKLLQETHSVSGHCIDFALKEMAKLKQREISSLVQIAIKTMVS